MRKGEDEVEEGRGQMAEGREGRRGDCGLPTVDAD